MSTESGPGEPPLIASADSADPRALGAWRTWLCALATDAHAALATALAYQELDGDGRESWLLALEQDLPNTEVPAIAAYAPLLAVETDAARRQRMIAALGDGGPTRRVAGRKALVGEAADGVRVAAIVSPLYLEFVQVLACGFRRNQGFLWVRHDPIAHRSEAPKDGTVLADTKLERTPLAGVVDDLALTILAERRAGRKLPEALATHADLFRAVRLSTVAPGTSAGAADAAADSAGVVAHAVARPFVVT